MYKTATQDFLTNNRRLNLLQFLRLIFLEVNINREFIKFNFFYSVNLKSHILWELYFI